MCRGFHRSRMASTTHHRVNLRQHPLALARRRRQRAVASHTPSLPMPARRPIPLTISYLKMNVAGGTLAIRSKIAVLGIVLLAVVAVDAREQDAVTVAVGGRGIGESCVTEIGEKAGRFARHGLKLDIVYTDGGGETQQADVSQRGQVRGAAGLLAGFFSYA